MKNWNQGNHEYPNLPEVLYRALSRVVANYIEKEREAYEKSANTESENHMYLELHCLDFWLHSMRHKYTEDTWNRDQPMLLQTLGKITASERAKRVVPEEQLKRILEAHRLYPWGMPDDKYGTGSSQIECILEHNGTLRSCHPFPGRTCHHEVEVVTLLTTETFVRVRELPLTGDSGVADYDVPGHRIDRNEQDNS